MQVSTVFELKRACSSREWDIFELMNASEHDHRFISHSEASKTGFSGRSYLSTLPRRRARAVPDSSRHGFASDVWTSALPPGLEKYMRKRPGEVRDAIVQVGQGRPGGASVVEITEEVGALIGEVPPSSIRSYLRFNTPALFARMDRAQYALNGLEFERQRATRSHRAEEFIRAKARLVHDDCLVWMERQPANSIHAVVTDPAYGLVEYFDAEPRKLGAGRGGVWRIPPSFDGAKRSPLPRFTVLKPTDLDALE
jgi:hypothetical protein